MFNLEKGTDACNFGFGFIGVDGILSGKKREKRKKKKKREKKGRKRDGERYASDMQGWFDVDLLLSSDRIDHLFMHCLLGVKYWHVARAQLTIAHRTQLFVLLH